MPGPWYIGSGTYEGRNIYSAKAVTDAEGFTYNPVVATAEDDGFVCWDANARLIAAANPAAIIELLDRLEAAERKRDELLAVCRGLLNAHRITFAKPPSTVEQAHRQLDLIEKAVSAAETAIAEAQGKEK